MAAMTMAPCADSVQDALDLLAASRRERSRGDGAASAKSPVVYLKARRLRAASRRRAALLRCRRRPPTHSQPRGPRETAHTQSTRRASTRRDSENQNHGRTPAAAARTRGHVAAAVPAARQKPTTQPRSHTHRDSESKPHRPANLSRDQSRVSEDDDDIHVIKRNGKKEVVRYDKITSRIKKLCYGLDSKYIKPNVRSRRPVVERRLHAVDATRLHLTMKWVV